MLSQSQKGCRTILRLQLLIKLYSSSHSSLLDGCPQPRLYQPRPLSCPCSLQSGAFVFLAEGSTRPSASALDASLPTVRRGLIRLQRVWRGRVARKWLAARMQAARTVQLAWRGRELWLWHEQRREAAVVMQTSWRGVAARLRLRRMLQQRWLELRRLQQQVQRLEEPKAPERMPPPNPRSPAQPQLQLPSQPQPQLPQRLLLQPPIPHSETVVQHEVKHAAPVAPVASPRRSSMFLTRQLRAQALEGQCTTDPRQR